MKYMTGPNGSFISEDELYHWKYIKRVKQPNGKWRYFYKDDKYTEIAKNYNNAKKSQQKATTSKEKSVARWKSEYFGLKYVKARDQYERSAGHKVAELLNKTSDKTHEAKKWVKNLFDGKSKSKNKSTNTSETSSLYKNTGRTMYDIAKENEKKRDSKNNR